MRRYRDWSSLAGSFEDAPPKRIHATCRRQCRETRDAGVAKCFETSSITLPLSVILKNSQGVIAGTRMKTQAKSRTDRRAFHQPMAVDVQLIPGAAVPPPMRNRDWFRQARIAARRAREPNRRVRRVPPSRRATLRGRPVASHHHRSSFAHAAAFSPSRIAWQTTVDRETRAIRELKGVLSRTWYRRVTWRRAQARCRSRSSGRRSASSRPA